jgi:hypothetical protein
VERPGRVSVDGDLGRLADAPRRDHRVGNTHDDLDRLRVRDHEGGRARTDERAGLDGLLDDVSVEGRHEHRVAERDLGLARLRLRGAQLRLGRVVLCAGRVEVGLGDAFRLPEA